MTAAALLRKQNRSKEPQEQPDPHAEEPLPLLYYSGAASSQGTASSDQLTNKPVPAGEQTTRSNSTPLIQPTDAVPQGPIVHNAPALTAVTVADAIPRGNDLLSLDPSRKIQEADRILYQACVDNNLIHAHAAFLSKASAKITNQGRLTPAKLAILNNNGPLLMLILANGGLCYPEELVAAAALLANEEICMILSHYLRKNGNYPDKNMHKPDEDPLVWALQQEKPLIAESFIRAGFPADDQLLFISLRKGYIYLAHLLLNPNPKYAQDVTPLANIHALDRTDRSTPLILAASLNLNHLAERILALCEKLRRLDPKIENTINATNNLGLSALWYACFFGNTNLALDLIQRDARIDISASPNQLPYNVGTIRFNKYELWTPLLLAAAHGDYQLLVELIRRRADVNGQLSTRQNALHLTILSDSAHIADCVLALCKAKIRVNEPDQEGMTALHLACTHEKWRHLIPILTDNDADPNSLNNKQETPLHLATGDGLQESVTALLHAKTAISRENKTKALEIADLNKNATLLLKIATYEAPPAPSKIGHDVSQVRSRSTSTSGVVPGSLALRISTTPTTASRPTSKNSSPRGNQTGMASLPTLLPSTAAAQLYPADRDRKDKSLF